MRNIFKFKKDELAMVLKSVLSRGLRPLFEVYVELLKRIDKSNHEISLLIEELTRSMGYDSQDVRCILEDLSMLNLISFKIIDDKEEYWKIKLLIY
jgi:transcription initiation factor IIE alpha subunit